MNLWINTAPGPRAYDWLSGSKPDPTHFPGTWEDADTIVQERDQLRERVASSEEPRTIPLTQENLDRLGHIHENAVIFLQQARSLTRSPIFAPGATKIVEELTPALVWMAAVLRQEGR